MFKNKVVTHFIFYRFFLKVDDDMWINSRVLMEQLNKRESQLQNATAGHCTMVSKVLRDSKNKWSVFSHALPFFDFAILAAAFGVSNLVVYDQ